MSGVDSINKNVAGLVKRGRRRGSRPGGRAKRKSALAGGTGLGGGSEGLLFPTAHQSRVAVKVHKFVNNVVAIPVRPG